VEARVCGLCSCAVDRICSEKIVSVGGRWIVCVVVY
jgi:hypothetical protein